jgi:hypothetical protein
MKMKFFLSLSWSLFILVFLSCGQKNGGDSASNEHVDFSGDVRDLGEGAILRFDTLHHAFGDLKSGEEVACRFAFTNTGVAPLLIQDVKAGCGCTNVIYPKQLINPGEEGVVELTFNTAGKRACSTRMWLSCRMLRNPPLY